MSAAPPTGALWVEVTQLLRWRKPLTGMPRVVASLLDAWLDEPGVRFARYAEASRGLLEVPRDELRQELERLRTRPANPPAGPSPDRPPAAREAWKHRLKRRAAPWVPRVLRRGLRAGWRRLRPAPVPPPAAPPEPPLVLTPADMLLLPEWSWGDPASRAVLGRAKREQGFRQATVVYDAIPFAAPQFFPEPMRREFLAWLAQSCRAADAIVTISQHSRRDIERFAAQHALPSPPVEVARLGDTLLDADEWTFPVPRLGLGEGEPFVLTVGTIYARKNQWLLYHAWRRLIETHGPAAVPKLVMVGWPWWLSEDLLALIAGDPLTRGHIVVTHDADDHELAGLYRHCLFTVYPSFYEGWGLPVAESLAFGKPCLASGATAMPEVGGPLADYFDPLDLPGFVRLVERMLFDPGHRAARAEQVRARYRRTTWADCARSLRQALAARFAADARAPRRAA
jgi:glycosyltransferase involved in cell wall biosynthesis